MTTEMDVTDNSYRRLYLLHVAVRTLQLAVMNCPVDQMKR